MRGPSIEGRTRLTPDRIVGAVLIALSLAVMAGWWWQIPRLVQLRPGWVGMAFNTALCFALAGIALAIPERYARLRRRVHVGVGLFLIILPSAVFAQNLLARDLGIDWPALHAWLADPNPHPGRMAPNTSLGFVLAGAVLLALNARHGVRKYAVQVLTYLLLVLSVLSLVGYGLKLELLYSWYQYTRMAVHTAAAFFLLGLGLAAMWYRAPWFARMYRGRDDVRISLMSGAIMIAITATAGVVSFVSIEEQTEKSLGNGLELALANRVDLFATAMQHSVEKMELIVGRSALRAQMQALARDPTDARVHAALQRLAEGALGAGGFGMVAFHTVDNRERVRVGASVQRPLLRVPVTLGHEAHALWDRGFVLRVRVPVRDDGKDLGFVVGEQPIPIITHSLIAATTPGTTAETVMCRREGERLRCFPSRMSPQGLAIPDTVDGQRLPILHAFAGGRGVTIARDYRRQHVLVAYAPLADTGLAMVLKMDTAELYAPIRRRLQQVVPLLLVLVAVGVVLLRWQVLPLVRALVQSEQTARARSEAVRRLASIVESSNDAIIGVDADGRVTSWNHAAEALYGYTAAEMLGKSVVTLLPDGAADRDAFLIARMRNGERIEHFETQRRHKDGRLVEVSLTISPIYDDAGNIVGASKIARDIGERKRAEAAAAVQAQELARSNRELEQFAYVASHDLQEPLRMVTSYTQLLARRYKAKLDGEADEFVAFIVDGVARMQALIQDLLAYSRVGSQGKPLGPVSMERVLTAVTGQLALAIADARATITHAPLPTVRGDEGQLQQLLLNLLTNALKFRGERPAQVHLGADAENGHWRLFVRDTGIGIAPQYSERIFEIFQRLHGRGQYPGTGIGLAICKKIVERHGGRIWVEPAPGGGTIFYFTLARA